MLDWMKALGMCLIVYGHVAAATTIPLTPPVYLKQFGVAFFFFATAFTLARHAWDSFESRVCANTERLLRIFDDANVRATFFDLGWVARRFPSLVRTIAAEGHETASLPNIW